MFVCFALYINLCNFQTFELKRLTVFKEKTGEISKLIVFVLKHIIAYTIDFQFNGRTIFLFCFWTHMSKNQNSFEILPFYLVQGEDL